MNHLSGKLLGALLLVAQLSLLKGVDIDKVIADLSVSIASLQVSTGVITTSVLTLIFTSLLRPPLQASMVCGYLRKVCMPPMSAIILWESQKPRSCETE